MTNSNKTAQDAHGKHLGDVAGKIEKLSQWLAEERNKEHIHWGHAGSAQHVSELLDNILEFLGM